MKARILTTQYVRVHVYIRDMLKHEQGIQYVKDILSVLNSELKMTTKKFTYFIVEELGTAERITSWDECPVNGILKLHSLVAQNGKVILLPWTCTVSLICRECKGRKAFVKPGHFSLGNNDYSILKDKIKLWDTDDEGQTEVKCVGDCYILPKFAV